MDKNTITGFILMALVLIGFSWYSRPSEEQIKAQHERDSIAAVQNERPTPDPSRDGGERLAQRNVSIASEGSEYMEAPIVINSGYRSEAVNKAVGGAATSNHLTGSAADIRVSGMEQALRYAVILLDISDESGEDFDELLIERNARGAIWLHFAVRASGNRRKLRFIS